MNDRFPFLIAAFVYLMDQYKQLGIVPPEEEEEDLGKDEEKGKKMVQGGKNAAVVIGLCIVDTGSLLSLPSL